MRKNLNTDQSSVMRILEHGRLDLLTLAFATFTNLPHIRRIIGDLMSMGLVVEEWDENKRYYRRS